MAWIKQAIREAADQVRAAAPVNAPCEVCGGEAAVPYTFAYARVTQQKTEYTGTGTRTTTYYDSIGARVVWLCKHCLLPTQKRLAARYLWLAVGIIVTTLVAASFIVLIRGWDLVLPLAFAALLILIFPYMLRRRVLRDIRFAGQQKALDLYEPQLRRQGCDTFWNDPFDIYGSLVQFP
jgi:hypothetical protein